MARPKGSKNKKKAVKVVETPEFQGVGTVQGDKVKVEAAEVPEVVEKIEIVEPVKEAEKQPEIIETLPEKPAIKDNSGLEDRPYFSVDEAARYLGVAEACARLWFDHGHLKGTNNQGFIRVSRASILKVKDSKLLK